MSDQSEVLFAEVDGIGHAILNRPKALNALTRTMVNALDRQLIAWAADDAVKAVVLAGAPREDGRRPFCAGGDVRAVTEIARSADPSPAKTFFAEEYTLNRRIRRFPKPYVSLLRGVTMGGGFGVSVHGSHRVCSEAMVFAMPETAIGLYPDVGGTYVLPRCPGEVGMYLALTGVRLGAADALYAGIGTHHVPDDRFDDLVEALAEADLGEDAGTAVSEIIARFVADPGVPPLAAKRELIDRCFGVESVEGVLQALAAESDPWAAETMATLAGKSPTSLKLTFAGLRRGRHLEFDDAMRMEFRMTMACLRGHDFFEGVRAVLVDKDNAPRWSPARLEEVDDAMIEGYFAPQPERDLSFD